MLKKIICTVFLVAIAITLARASEMQFLQIDMEDCGLFESGTGPHATKLYFGTKTFGTCSVVIPRKEFSRNYEFCALAGVLAAPLKESIMCQFEYWDKEKNISLISNSNQLCIFMCMKKR